MAAAFRHFKIMKKKGFKYLDIELTERCNNRCIHCYINQPSDDQNLIRKEMPTDRVKAILDEAKRTGTKVIRLTGGEPLLRKDFTEIYEYASGKKFSIRLATNGTLMDDRTADALKKYKPRSVIISLYGWDDASYGRITGNRQGFRMLMSGLKKLILKNIPFDISLPPLKELLNHSDKIHALARSLNAKIIEHHTWDLILRVRREEQLSERIRLLRLHPEEIRNHMARSENWLRSEKRRFRRQRKTAGTDTHIFKCAAHRERATIDACGNLLLCLELRHPATVYNLKKGSLLDARYSFFPELYHIQSGRRIYIERCARCRIRSLCVQCPATSWVESGILDEPSPYYCKIAHAEARLLGILSENENGWDSF